MSDYDYASQLLGGRKPADAPAYDYATAVLGGKDEKGSPFAGLSFKTLPIVNRASNDGSADFGTLTKAAMVDDPKTKLRIFANDLFPGDAKAVDRFGIVDGEVVYVGKDDKLYRATPGGVAGGLKEFGANMAGNALPIAGGVVGGISPFPGGAAVGAMGGKGINQVIANTVFDEPQTVGGNIGGMAQEGAFSQAGQFMGSLFTNFLTRNAVKDVSKLDPAAVAALDKKAADVGGTGIKVDLNLGQRTDLRSVKGKAEMLARYPGTADAMDESLTATNNQAAAAANKYVDTLSPFKTLRSSGEAGRTGALSILEKLAEDRATASRPLYEKALNVVIDTKDPELMAVAGTDAFKRGYERALRIAANDGLDLSKEQNAMKMLHYVKLGIGDLLDKSAAVKEGIGSTERASIASAQNKLVAFMDKQSPDYAQARSVYGHYMPTLKMNREGLMGQLADLSDADLSKAAKTVFGQGSAPQDIAALRSMFYRYDQPEKWKGLLAGYLRDTLETAGKELKSGNATGQATTWRYNLLGDQQSAARLRASMTADQFDAFKSMMDVFEAVGRVKGQGNSITAEMLAQKQALDQSAGKGASALLQPRQAVIDWLQEARLGKHADKMVEIINSKDGIDQIAQLRKLSPNEDAFYRGFARLVGASASPEQNKPVPLK